MTRILFLLAGIAALALSYRWENAPTLSNDSCQYIDAASHIAHGKGAFIDIAHFDEQVAFGRLPVPFTHFPPGYPVLVAIVSLVAPLETAGYIIAAAGFLLTIWLIWDLALALGARTLAIAPLCLLWIVHEGALAYAANVGTDSIFTAALIATAVLIARDMRAEGRSPALLIGLGATAAAAYLLRYAGLFLLPVAALYIAWRALRTARARMHAVIALALEGALVAAVMIRNVMYTGSWKGGFSSGSANSLRKVLTEMAKAFYHIVFGSGAIAHADLWTILFAVSLIAACVCWRNGFRVPPALGWMGILVAAYVAGILLVALTSIAADLSRYLLPVYPVLLAVLAALFSFPGTRVQLGAVAVLAMSVLAVQSRNIAVRPILSPNHVAAIADLAPVRQFLLDHVPPSGTIVSVNGQAVQYQLQRPVVSVIEPEFSSRSQDEASFHALMKQFSARYLLVFPGENKLAVSPQISIPFLRDLAAGTAPDWMKPAATAAHATVYECADCSTAPTP